MIYFLLSLPFVLLSVWKMTQNLKENPAFFVYIFLVAWVFGASYASVTFLVLNEVYISELGVYSYPNSSPLVISIIWLFSILIFNKKIDLRFSHFSRRYISLPVSLGVLFVFVFVSLILLVFNLASSDIPLLGGGSRFEYWENSRFPWLRLLLGETSAIIAFCCGLLYEHSRSRLSATFLLLFLVYMFYLIMLGNKFSALLIGVVTFLTPIFVAKTKFYFSLRFIFISLFFGFSVFFLVYYYYENFGNDFSKNLGLGIVEAIFYRLLALQGQLLWASVNDGGLLGGMAFSFLERPMESLMHYHIGAAANDALERGVSFTNAFPGYLFYVFGVLAGACIATFYLVPIWITGSALIQALRSQRLFLSVLFWQAHQWAVYGVVMGYMGSLLKGIFLLLIILILCKVLEFICVKQSN